MKFTENFSDFPRVLQCSLPFYWFKRYGQRVIIYVKTTKKVISGDGIGKDCMNIIYSGM